MMTATARRHELCRLAEERGWQRTPRQRVDLYHRDGLQVQVVWQGDDAISGASRYEDYVMSHYTRELTTVEKWFNA